MDSGRWPSAIRQRLAEEGAVAMADVLDNREDAMLTLATERFELRLGEECAKLRAEMSVMRSEVIAEIANCRADLIKWAFLFWIGQLAAVTTFVTMLR